MEKQPRDGAPRFTGSPCAGVHPGLSPGAGVTPKIPSLQQRRSNRAGNAKRSGGHRDRVRSLPPREPGPLRDHRLLPGAVTPLPVTPRGSYRGTAGFVFKRGYKKIKDIYALNPAAPHPGGTSQTPLAPTSPV